MSSFRVRARGEYAMFTIAALRSEPVSYPVMTPTAAIGLLEAIHWKPEIRWVVEQIEVLKPIRFYGTTYNEMSRFGEADITKAENCRMQRRHRLLYDVDYIIQARIEAGRPGREAFCWGKHADQFSRRLRKGAHAKQPYLGQRQYFADVAFEADDDPKPIQQSLFLGRMIRSVWNASGVKEPEYFDAEMVDGVVRVP